MVIRRSPSARVAAAAGKTFGNVLGSGGTRGLPSGDASEHAPNRHAETRGVTFAEDIAGHYFARRENIGS
jgi:hypothetical protein